MYKKNQLSNGLTILKVPIKGAKSVVVDVFVKTGSRSEKKEVNGISHFLEHLFFKGSEKYPTAMDLSQALDAIGAEYNANTGKEHTQYYIKSAKKHLPFIFETLSDVIQNPTFNKEEIEREKGVIVEEINMYEDLPMRNVDDLLEQMMWPKHPLGRNIAGSKEVINSMERQDIVDYKQNHYQPGNMILAVAGGFDDKEFDSLVDQCWGGVAAKDFPKWEKAENGQTEMRVKNFTKQTEQYHLSFGFRGLEHNHKDNYTQAVLAAVLGGGMSSRLFSEIREKRGLAYYVKASAEHYQDTGVFLVKGGIRKDALKDAVKVFSKELHRLKTKSVQSEELKKAKEFLKGTLTLALEDNATLLGYYLEQTAFRSEVLEPDQLFEKIDKVTSDQIQKLSQKIFDPVNLNLAVLGPETDEGEIKSLISL